MLIPKAARANAIQGSLDGKLFKMLPMVWLVKVKYPVTAIHKQSKQEILLNKWVAKSGRRVSESMNFLGLGETPSRLKLDPYPVER